MKKLCLSLFLFMPVVFATPQKELNKRFEKLNSFTAEFSQTVTDPDGKNITKGKGRFSVKRPNLFKWEIDEPDENVLVSDGKTLWHYNPFIEQVSAMWLDEATSKTPFALLTRNRPNDWDNYKVTQNGDRFTLSPKQKGGQGDFIVHVLPDGFLTEFSLVEQDGQTNRFELNGVTQTTLKDSLFQFSVPKGVEFDDQRK